MTKETAIEWVADKPALLKAGAEKLGMTFRLAPRFSVTERQLEGGHREIEETGRAD